MSAKPLPSELTYRSFYSEVRSVDDDQMKLIATISTATVDRMGDIVEQDGWELENYQKNPVVLWGHDYSIPPVGKAAGIRVVNGKLKAEMEFAPTDMGREVWNLYKGGFMSAFSVGFKPLDWEQIRDAEGTFKGFRYKRNELLEFSCVPVPANQDAVVHLRHAVQRGMLPNVLRYLPTDVTREPPDVEVKSQQAVMDTLSFLTTHRNIARLLGK